MITSACNVDMNHVWYLRCDDGFKQVRHAVASARMMEMMRASGTDQQMDEAKWHVWKRRKNSPNVAVCLRSPLSGVMTYSRLVLIEREERSNLRTCTDLMRTWTSVIALVRHTMYLSWKTK
jgi:hypothetical protein